jgi:hypothetical protein
MGGPVVLAAALRTPQPGPEADRPVVFNVKRRRAATPIGQAAARARSPRHGAGPRKARTARRRANVPFEVVAKKTFRLPEPLAEDAISIQRSAVATLRLEPLAMIGVTDRAVVLADPELMRIGIRRPTEDEADIAFAVHTLRSKAGKDSRRRHVNLTPAIRRLGIEPREVGGRYTLMSVEATLFVTLTDMSTGDRARETARVKRAAQIAKDKGRTK